MTLFLVINWKKANFCRLNGPCGHYTVSDPDDGYVVGRVKTEIIAEFQNIYI